jgi:hypothetical protein
MADSIRPIIPIGRNPFARFDVVRQACGPGTCNWCGRQRRTVFRYGHSPDGGRGGWFKGFFCSKSCCESYHDRKLDS